MSNPMMRRLEQRIQTTQPYGFRGKNIQMGRLMGMHDSRGRYGIFARGKNVYLGGSRAAHHKKGYGMGRPSKTVLSRRLRANKER